MTARLILALLTAIAIFEVFMWESHATIIRRELDSDSQQNDSQTMYGVLQSFKNGIDDLVKIVQANELVQNVSDSLRSFGAQVQEKGQQLATKIRNAVTT